MRNLMEENPKLAIALIVGATIGGFLLSSSLKDRQEAQEKLIEEMETGGQPPPPPRSDRMKELEKTRYREPVAALKELDAIVAAPANANERVQAKDLHPRQMRDTLNHLIKQADWEAGKKLLDRLLAEYPESDSTDWAQKDWVRARGELARNLTKEGKLDESLATLKELADAGWIFQDGNAIAELRKTMAEAWTKNGSKPDDPRLLQAAGLLPGFSRQSDLAVVLVASDLPGEAILKRAQALQSGADRFRSLSFYEAALLRLNDNRKPWLANGGKIVFQRQEAIRRDAEKGLTGALLALADALHEGRVELITAINSEQVLESGGRMVRNQDLLAPMFRRLVQIQTERLLKLMEPVAKVSLASLADPDTVKGEAHNQLNQQIRESWNLADNIRRRAGARLWSCLVADTSFNPWPLLPTPIRAGFEEKRAKGTKEESLRQSVASLGGRKGFHTPLDELKIVRQLHAGITARRGMLTYDVQPAECVRWFREALADSDDDALRAEIIDATVKALGFSRKAEKFLAFYELTGFLVADIGIENLPEALRGQLLGSLGEVASGLADREPPKSVFLQAIQAETLADGPQRQRAKEESIAAAYKIVSRVKIDEVKADLLPPSDLDGLSVLSIDNSTEHHLLVFYKGPESFFLACRPYRKVSAALKDGDYEVAVIAPSGAISPYHGKVSLAGRWQPSNYTIGRSNQDPDLYGARNSSASGEYVLARVPDGVAGLSVDARTGKVTKKP